jgi:UDP-glucuronate 4-epimerase|tara:strand:- start:4 stop:990 length:987 start_codon:yes stop_codon:yes gene_type:complete
MRKIKKNKILITGCAGFIGFHCSAAFLKNKKFLVIGIDNINNYYDQNLKLNRLKILKKDNNFTFVKIDMNEEKKIYKLFEENKFSYVIHLAAQAGVKYSIKNPREYLSSNINGFFNILEASRIFKVKHFIYASSSSVYGDNKSFPLKENLVTDKPLSFYAATKKSNELMAYSYSNIYNLPTTGLRFFTVYGPWGRPDMALFKFTDSILKSKTLTLFNNGKHVRDFTYIDDVVRYLTSIIYKPSLKKIPYQIFNISSNDPKHLMTYLKQIEISIGKKTKVKKENLQKGDIYKTHGDSSAISKITKIKISFDINKGIRNFVLWYKNYFKF